MLWLKQTLTVLSERQLKRKIKDWNLEKNVKGDEVKVIVRRIRQRAATGKSTIFRMRGLPMDPAKIERWQKRSGTLLSSTDATFTPYSRKLYADRVPYDEPCRIDYSCPINSFRRRLQHSSRYKITFTISKELRLAP